MRVSEYKCVAREGRQSNPRANGHNSYCLYCGTIHFGLQITDCPRCKGKIWSWIPTEDLWLLQKNAHL